MLLCRFQDTRLSFDKFQHSFWRKQSYPMGQIMKCLDAYSEWIYTFSDLSHLRLANLKILRHFSTPGARFRIVTSAVPKTHLAVANFNQFWRNKSRKTKFFNFNTGPENLKIVNDTSWFSRTFWDTFGAMQHKNHLPKINILAKVENVSRLRASEKLLNTRTTPYNLVLSRGW